MQQLAAEEIGARIAQARNEAGGMTQPQLAELLDLSLRQVQNIEAGETIPYKYFQRLEQIFPSRTMGWFLHGDEDDASALSADDLDARLAAIEAEIRDLRRVLEGLAADVQQSRAAAQ